MARWQDMSQDDLLEFCRDYARKIRTQQLRLGRWHYALAMAHGVREAIHCGYGRMTAVELGVWVGTGLLELCRIADYLGNALGVEINVVGFDRAEGLPELNGYMDHPELWHGGAFKMPDPAVLRGKLPPFAKLIIGDISETIPQFESELAECPLGFVAFDVDLYTSTKQALRILKFAPESYLPAVPAIMDDSHYVLTHSDWCGEAAAVREFNEVNTLRKIDRRFNFDIRKFFCCQIFDHPIRSGAVRPRFPLSLGDF